MGSAEAEPAQITYSSQFMFASSREEAGAFNGAKEKEKEVNVENREGPEDGDEQKAGEK